MSLKDKIREGVAKAKKIKKDFDEKQKQKDIEEIERLNERIENEKVKAALRKKKRQLEKLRAEGQPIAKRSSGGKKKSLDDIDLGGLV